MDCFNSLATLQGYTIELTNRRRVQAKLTSAAFLEDDSARWELTIGPTPELHEAILYLHRPVESYSRTDFNVHANINILSLHLDDLP